MVAVCAIFHGDVLDHFFAQQAPANLRLNIAHQHFRETGVVANDPQHVFIAPALVEQLHGAQLQAFLEDLRGGG